MQNLDKASRELFKRSPDESFSSLAALADHCETQRQDAAVYWYPPDRLRTVAADTRHLVLSEAEDVSFEMNDWSFGQLCRLASVEKVCHMTHLWIFSRAQGGVVHEVSDGQKPTEEKF